MSIPNDKAAKANNEKMSLKDCAIKMVSSEGFLLLLGLTAIALDPLFFYVPMMKSNPTCLGLDKTLILVAVTLRTLVDVLHDWSWWSKSCDGNTRYLSKRKAEQKRASGVDRLQNLLKWFKSYQISSPIGRSGMPSRVIAVVASLPLPQVVVLALDVQSGLQVWILLGVTFQFVPRYFRIYSTYEAVTTSSSIYAWIGAAFNLLHFVLASHALGGFWYLRAVERKMNCMKKDCGEHGECIAALYCESGKYANNRFINDFYALRSTSNTTRPCGYGIYSDAVEFNLIGSTNIIDKLAHGIWWGINNLSSMAQNLKFSDYKWDTGLEIFICILGLFLTALLIGNLQLFVQSKRPSKLEEMNEKRRQLQKWPPFSILPRDLRKEVNLCKRGKWLQVSEIDLESFLNNISWELKKKIKPYFYKDLFNKVKEFEELNEEITKELREEIKKELRDRARPVVFQARTIIHEEGRPFYEMIQIIQGKVLAYNNNDLREGLPAKQFNKDDYFGEEVLHRALKSPLPKLPLAQKTIQSTTKVEAFALSFDDFATIFTKYGYSIEPYKEEWAANVINRASRKYSASRKRSKSSHEEKEPSLKISVCLEHTWLRH